jgi:hypothetical protein
MVRMHTILKMGNLQVGFRIYNHTVGSMTAHDDGGAMDNSHTCIPHTFSTLSHRYTVGYVGTMGTHTLTSPLNA